MKRILLLFLLLATLTGCANDTKARDVETAALSADAFGVVETAMSEFQTIFSEFVGLRVIEIATMARTDDGSDVVIQFTYTSENGNGVYGFEFVKDEGGAYQILRQGEDVAIDNLVGE